MCPIGILMKGRDRIGFTFIELLMVIVILGIFVAMATPNFRNTYLELELSSQARSLAKFLTYAQERAVVEGKAYRFEIDPVQRRYWLTVERELESEDGTHFARIEGRYGRIVKLPSGISVAADKEKILFSPDGSSDSFSLSLRDQEGRELVLKNGKPIGVVHVEEGRTSERVFAF